MTLCAKCKAQVPTITKRLGGVNAGLHAMGKHYWDSIGQAFATIDVILREYGFDDMEHATDEAGQDHRIHLRVDQEKDKWLHISWYRIPSGRYEVTAYVN